MRNIRRIVIIAKNPIVIGMFILLKNDTQTIERQ